MEKTIIIPQERFKEYKEDSCLQFHIREVNLEDDVVVVCKKTGSSEEQIKNYLKMEDPTQCVGSIKSEGLGITLLEEIQCNDPTAVIGLPLIKLSQMFEKYGVI